MTTIVTVTTRTGAIERTVRVEVAEAEDTSPITHGIESIMADLTALTNAVNAQTSVEQSVLALINTLVDEIRAAANDPEQIQSLANQIQANTDALSAAVAANTPAGLPSAPTEPETPVEPSEDPIEPAPVDTGDTPV